MAYIRSGHGTGLIGGTLAWHHFTKLFQCLAYCSLVLGAQASSMPEASDAAACVPIVSVASNSGWSGLGVAVELDGPEVDPEGNALPTGAAGATLVALALSRAEGIVAGGEGSGVLNKGRPLSG